MRARSITAVVAALALLHAAPARAAGPQPPSTASAGVRSVYADFGADKQISGCDHTLADLQQTKSTMPAAVADGYPAFADQVQTAIGRHASKACPNDRVRAATPTPTPTPTPTATATPSSTPESGQLPPGTAGGGGGGAVPPAPAITPAATATPVPTAASPVAVAPTPTPAVITHEGHRSLTLPLVLIGLAVLGAGALAFSAVAGRRSAGVRHAWREAALRTRGTWADFSDWLRLGR